MANGAAAKASSKPKGEGVFARMIKFIKDSYNETVKKSAWPTSKELRQFTAVVIFAVLVVALWIAGVDAVVGAIADWIKPVS